MSILSANGQNSIQIGFLRIVFVFQFFGHFLDSFIFPCSIANSQFRSDACLGDRVSPRLRRQWWVFLTFHIRLSVRASERTTNVGGHYTPMINRFRLNDSGSPSVRPSVRVHVRHICTTFIVKLGDTESGSVSLSFHLLCWINGDSVTRLSKTLLCHLSLGLEPDTYVRCRIGRQLGSKISYFIAPSQSHSQYETFDLKS